MQVDVLYFASLRERVGTGQETLDLDPELDLAREVADEVRGYFDTTVFQTLIPRDVLVSEAPSHGQSVLDYAPRARGAWAYTELVMEVIDREHH